MARKVWIAQEIENLSPEQQQALFDESLVTDLADVPPDLLARVRADARRLIDGREPPRAE